MHILLGFFVAAGLLYWWARGSVIVAIMGTLFAAVLACAGGAETASGLAFAVGVACASWAPAALRLNRRATLIVDAAPMARYRA